MNSEETLQDLLNELFAEKFSGQVTINFEDGHALRVTKKSQIKLTRGNAHIKSVAN